VIFDLIPQADARSINTPKKQRFCVNVYARSYRVSIKFLVNYMLCNTGASQSSSR